MNRNIIPQRRNYSLCYTIEVDRVIANYEAVAIVAIPTLDDRLTAVEDVLMDILI
jgi:hypothetical protein